MNQPPTQPPTGPPNKHTADSVTVHELIARRWSPRALDENHELHHEQLRALLEAARWAPSFGNTQPARYLVGLRGDESYRRILATLTERNQSWAHRASALLIAVAVTSNAKGEIPLAEYGVGMASENLVLQAVAEGLVAHQMAGFDDTAARAAFDLPDHTRPIVAIAVGRQADAEVLAAARDVERERAPRSRHDLAEIAFTETWGRPAFP